MSKSKILTPVLCVVLAIMLALSITLGIVIPNTNKITLSTSGNGESAGKDIINLMDLKDANVAFEVKATSKKVLELVTVTDGQGNKVNVRYALNTKGNTRILAPKSGYERGIVYTIKLKDGASFVDYPGTREIRFSIYKENITEIEYYDNVINIANSDVITSNDNSLVIRADIYDIGIGTVIIVDGDEEGAYKVESLSRLGNNLELFCTRPDITEVFEKLEVHTVDGVTDENMTFNEEAARSQMNNSPMMSAFSQAGLIKPTVNFNVNYDKDRGVLIFGINLVFDGIFANAPVNNSLTIGFVNEMDVDLVQSYSRDLGNNFRLGVDVKNTTVTTINLNFNKSGTEIQNVQDVIKDLEAILGEDSLAQFAKIFTFTVPIATGFNFSYDMDFVFRYGFSGDIGIDTTASIDYTMGVVMADGKLQTYATFDAEVEEILLRARGVLNLKAGIINYLSLNILNIVGAGVEIELGAYSDLYGAGQIKINYIADTVDADGGYYVEGGFYWDIRLKACLGIPNVLDISETFSLAGGKEKLFDFGDPEFDLDITADNSEIVLTSLDAKLPTYYVNRYNMISNSYTKTPIPFGELEFLFENDSVLRIVGDNIKVNKGALSVDEYITVKYDGAEVKTHVFMSDSAPRVSLSYFDYDKLNPKDIIINLELFNSMFGKVEGNNLATGEYSYDYATKTLTIYSEHFMKRVQGNLEYTIYTTDNVIPITVNVVGELNLYSRGQGTAEAPYEIYVRDQIMQMIDEANNGADFENMVFELRNDIDMSEFYKGKYIDSSINAISNFKGVIDGNGYTISNYIINSSEGNAIGFIVNNYGEINNMTFNGTISAAKRGTSYVGGVVGNNYGTINNVVVEGTVTNYIADGGKKAVIYIGGIAGINNGTIINCESKANLSGVAKLDLVWIYYNIGGVAGQNLSEITDSVFTGNYSVKSEGGLSVILKGSMSFNEIAN